MHLFQATVPDKAFGDWGASKKCWNIRAATTAKRAKNHSQDNGELFGCFFDGTSRCATAALLVPLAAVVRLGHSASSIDGLLGFRLPPAKTTEAGGASPKVNDENEDSAPLRQL
mmetsp:Transcript_7957/g.11480  ORF Transcript_7957/g.11480 Transcript_7957/m.11480 type:complete len:114 (+) Transcript_7957:268-609(+)|eukprot:CAMPEP_0194771940 /NCGR_PEP_ID=MMETSP0323_2-20130528/50555_1 /TAXON_ID=2866 ORGANISM="Crypthecodinium cohnii, Strain Seligo" /NCGR_SAMPLE_ID=MMETSP0323_2 /ASSEMBLY_ACC=CAM_ASM_000346 /LENGTH=113 /DNA_ID=CAMNT_0039706265 /DNA_START=207 /DNA_END=548 /DNA_ORIENTATION=+